MNDIFIEICRIKLRVINRNYRIQELQGSSPTNKVWGTENAKK